MDFALQTVQKDRRPDADLIVILLHDGYSFDSAAPQADKLRALAKTKLFVVGVNEKVWK